MTEREVYATPKHITVTKPQPMSCPNCGRETSHVYVGLERWACVRCNVTVPGKAPEAQK